MTHQTPDLTGFAEALAALDQRYDGAEADLAFDGGEMSKHALYAAYHHDLEGLAVAHGYTDSLSALYALEAAQYAAQEAKADLLDAMHCEAAEEAPNA